MKDDRALSNAIFDVLMDIGVPPHLKGYRYLEEAILMVYKDRKLLYGIYKNIYTKLAEGLDITAASMERCLRNAIEVAWNRGNSEAQYKYFGNCVSCITCKPTTKEFIATVAEWLLHNYDQ